MKSFRIRIIEKSTGAEISTKVEANNWVEALTQVLNNFPNPFTEEEMIKFTVEIS